MFYRHVICSDDSVTDIVAFWLGKIIIILGFFYKTVTDLRAGVAQAV
jgi:hypothetical protein